jgi:SnoaL-like domain
MKHSLEEELRKLLDKQAIHEVVLRIARGTDRFDTDLLAECIAPDAVIDMGGAKPMSGAEFAAALTPPPGTRPGRMHLVSNVLVSVDGARAFAETYIVSYQDVLRGGDRFTRIRAGRYLDQFHRSASGWKLTGRTLIDEWGRADKVLEALPQGKHRGQPAPADMLYALLEAQSSEGN